MIENEVEKMTEDFKDKHFNDKIGKEVTAEELWEKRIFPEDRIVVANFLSNAIDFGLYSGTIDENWKETGFENAEDMLIALTEYAEHTRQLNTLIYVTAKVVLEAKPLFEKVVMNDCAIEGSDVPEKLSSKYLRQLMKRRDKLIKSLR